jgi:hypothetical protein
MTIPSSVKCPRCATEYWAAVERCWKRPVMVRDVKGESVEMCRLQDLELKEDQAGQSGG